MRDDEGQSPLDKALDSLYDDGCVDVALYLMSRGCGFDEDQAKLLCEACLYGKLGAVKELVEQHKVDPKSECDDLFNPKCIVRVKKPVEDRSAYSIRAELSRFFGGEVDFMVTRKLESLNVSYAQRSHT